MRSLRLSHLAMAVAVVAALSLLLVAANPSAGAPDVEQTTHVESTLDSADGDRLSSTQNETVAETGPAEIDSSLQDAEGTVTTVARLHEPDPLRIQASDDPAGELQRHAERTQQPLATYAADTSGVEVVTEYWITNAVVLEIDTDRADMHGVAAVDNVERLHENFEVNVPSPSTDTEAERDGGSVETDGATANEDPSAAAAENVTYGLDMVNAPDVWEQYDTMGSGVKVAVLDTGVDVTHPDIDLYTENPDDPTYPGGWANFTDTGDRVTDERPHDDMYHGTHVSGTVAGGNASGEYIGVAPEADLMHGKVLHGEMGTGTFAGIVAGMEWAVEEDADIISMSLGAPGTHPEFVEPVENARDAGTILVASAGNDGLGTSGSPGNIHGTIAVGAVDERASVAAFSGGDHIDTEDAFGDAAPDDWPDEYIIPDVAGPGVNVTSAFPGGDYQAIAGTSMSAPHVSGVTALVLASTDTDVPADLVTDALIESTWKPDDAPDEQDYRYGHGIVDAQQAVAIAKGDTGVTGVVERAEDGVRLSGAPVFVENGSATETDLIGTYSIPTTAGTHSVFVDPPGYESASTEVTVEDGEYTVADFTLARTLELLRTDSEPEHATEGERYSVTFDTYHPDNVTIEYTGEYGNESDVQFFVDTDETWSEVELEPGEPYDLADLRDDDWSDYPLEVELIVETEETSTDGDSDIGNVTAETQFVGFDGETENYTVGPTAIYDADRSHDVAVVSDPIVDDRVFDDPIVRELGPDLVDRLEEALPDHHDVTLIRGADQAAQQVDEYDVFVVQDEPDVDAMREFVEATQRSDTGVVYLDQHGSWSDGITRLSEATGNPTTVGTHARTHVPFEYDISSFEASETDHEIMDVAVDPELDEHLVEDRGWQEDHGHVPVRAGAYVSWMEEYQSEDVALIANENCGWFGCSPRPIDENTLRGDQGTVTGFGVDELSRTVLASGLGETAWGGEYFDEGDQILTNSVLWAATETDGVSINEHQPWKVEPEMAIEHDVSAAGVENVTIELNEYATVDAEDVELTIVDADGEHAVELGERFEPNVTAEDELTVRVNTTADAIGELSLDHAYELEDESVVSGSTGPTSVYTGDQIRVTDDDDLQTMVDTVRPGDEVVVEDGTYDPVWIKPDNQDVTVRAVEGATPIIEQTDERYERMGRSGVLHVSADGVTVDGFELNTTGQTYNNGVGVWHPAEEYVEDVTVQNMTIIEPYNGVWAGLASKGAHNVEIRNVEVEDPFWAGIRSHGSDDVLIEDSVVRNADRTGIELSGNENARVVNNTIVDAADQGVDSLRSTATIANNHIEGGDVGIVAGSSSANHVSDNVIEGASVGIDVAVQPTMHDDPDFTQRLIGNEIAGDIGISADVVSPDAPDVTFAEAELIEVRSNDLSGTDVGVENQEDEAGTLDARLNYFGPSGPASAADGVDQPDRPSVSGDVMADPFLPTPAADASTVDDAGFATAVDLEAGETYALGVPGPTDATVGEMIGEFEGVVYGYEAETGSWEQRTGDHRVEPLEALLVVPESDVTVVMDFETDGESPPSPSSHDLEEGWNFVTAPHYGPANESFGPSSADVSVVSPYFEQPAGQLAESDEPGSSFSLEGSDDKPTVSAFTGYFVFAEDDGQLPARLGEDPSIDEFYAELGIDGPSVGQYDGTVSDTAFSAATRDAVRQVTSVAPEEHEAVAGDRVESALLDEASELPADERAAFVEIATTELVSGLAAEPPEDEDELEAFIETTVEEAALVSIDDTDGTSTEGGWSTDGTAPTTDSTSTIDGSISAVSVLAG